MEEERRLAYVGITRARQLLYLVSAERRTLYGSPQYNEPSRFIEDVPPELVEVMGGRSHRSAVRSEGAINGSGWGSASNAFGGRAAFVETPSGSASSSESRLTEPRFTAGEKVQHKHFGVGFVISSALSSGDEEVVVQFTDKRGAPVRKTLLASLAGLEPL